MIIEMHSHTAEHSPCSHVSAVDIVTWMVGKGLQGIVLTDHHYMWTEDEIARLRTQVGVPAEFVVLPGQETEVQRFGHVLVYGAGETLSPGVTLEEIRSCYPEAALVWAHPYRNGRRPTDDQLMNPLLDAIEIFSSNHSVIESYRGLEDWHRLKFTAISGTDTHARSYGGTYPTIFDHPIASIQDLAGEIRAGRCRPYFKEIPKFGTTKARVTELTFGTKGEDEERQRLIVKKHSDEGSWRRGERTFRLVRAIASSGFREGPYRVPEPLESDRAKRAVIERGIRGRTLFDVVVQGDAEAARTAVDLAARWLARLHNLHLTVTPVEEFLREEPERLGRYLGGLYESGNTRADRVSEIKELVLAQEVEWFAERPDLMVQGHGDYHPKNVLVGRDRTEDRDTTFVAAVDFGSSYRMPRAFDVGTFMAQFRNQFFHHEGVFQKVDEDFFYESYVNESDELPPDFRAEVELYRARCGLSILYYLNKVGMGQSEDFWRVMVGTEQIMGALALNRSSG